VLANKSWHVLKAAGPASTPAYFTANACLQFKMIVVTDACA
jgi:hypothetical protein